MPGTAFDFISPPDPDELVANGADLVFLYAQEARDPDRLVGYAWKDAVLARGIGIIYIWERGTIDSHGGYDAGVRDAQAAEAYARAKGYPDGAALFYNLGDTNAHGADGYENAIRDYCAGVRSVNPTRPLGGYGPGHAMPYTGGWYRWVPETWQPDGADVVQIVNHPSPIGGADIDTLNNLAIPQWGGHGTHAPVDTAEDDMTPEQLKTLGGWMQDQAFNVVHVLTGVSRADYAKALAKPAGFTNPGILGAWEQDTRAQVIAAVKGKTG